MPGGIVRSHLMQLQFERVDGMGSTNGRSVLESFSCYAFLGE